MRTRSVSFPATRTDTDDGAEGGPVASDTTLELLHPSVLQATTDTAYGVVCVLEALMVARVKLLVEWLCCHRGADGI